MSATKSSWRTDTSTLSNSASRGPRYRLDPRRWLFSFARLIGAPLLTVESPRVTGLCVKPEVAAEQMENEAAAPGFDTYRNG
jgi:hypothetical protein